MSSICSVRGNAGFGKTVNARSVVENCKLRTDRVVDLDPFGTSIVLHYFFRNNKIETVSQSSLLRSLLQELLLAFPHIWCDIMNNYNKTMGVLRGQHKEFTFRPDGLWNALEDVLSVKISEHALLILDALDETSAWESSSILGRLVEIIRSRNQSQRTQRVKVLVFSRPSYDTDKFFSGAKATLLEMGRDQTLSDLRTFVSAVVPEFGRENGFPESAISTIQDRILVGADGMFLWAHLAWEHFKQGVTVWNQAKVKSQLDSLGHLPRGLGELYMRLLNS